MTPSRPLAPSIPRETSPPRPLWPAALGVGMIALILYTLTAAPGLLWGDSAAFALRVWRGELNNPLGLALAHPLYIILARGFTWLLPGDFAWRVNLFSALCGAAALPLMYVAAARLTGRSFAAWVAVLLLALSHTYWTHAVIAEVYSLYALGLAAELCLLERFVRTRRRGWLNAALFINGLGICNHLLALLHLPGYLLLAAGMSRRGEWRWRGAAPPLIFWLVGCSLYLAMIAGRLAAGDDPVSVLREALTGRQYARNMTGSGFTVRGDALKTAAAFLMNFPTPLLLFAIPGALALLRRPAVFPSSHEGAGSSFPPFQGGTQGGSPPLSPVSRRVTQWMLALIAIDFAFGFIYTVPDKYVFFFPCYVLLPLLAAAGAASWADRRARRALIILLALLPALVYEVAPPLLSRRNVGLSGVRDLPGRDKYSYFFRPRKNGITGAAPAAAAALRHVGPGGLLLADSTVKAALVYLREAGGISRDVLLAEEGDPIPRPPAAPCSVENIRRFVAAGRCYLFDATPGYVLPDWIARDYALVPDGPIYRVTPRPG